MCNVLVERIEHFVVPKSMWQRGKIFISEALSNMLTLRSHFVYYVKSGNGWAGTTLSDSISGEPCLLAASGKCDLSVKSKTFLRELKNRLSVM